jgi:hypothetical protein
MRKIYFFLILLTATVSFVGSNSTTALAQRSYRVSEAQVSTSLQTLERDSDYFSRSLQTALDRSRLNDTASEDEVINYVRDFEEATDRLKQRFDNRQSVGADVEEVLSRANIIDRFLLQNRLGARVTSDWSRVQTSLNTLAGYYGVRWNRNNYPTTGGYPSTGNYPSRGGNYAAGRLNGTYRLDVARSSDVTAEIDRAIGDLDMNRRERIRRNALRRLEAPEYIAVERSGNNVTVASTKSPRVTFVADGRARTETMPNGRTMSITSNLYGDQLVVNFTGDRANDYYFAFNPQRAGNELRVTRRIYLEGVARQITVDSFYTKTSDVAEFDTLYREDSNVGGYNNNNNAATGDFVVASGTRLTAILNSNIDTKTAQVGDQFTMEVTSPNEYRGATIEGRVASVERSGRVSGRAKLGLDFDSIRLRDGRTYRFAGLVDTVRTADNENVGISNEGEVREGNNQTTRTVTRTAVGAALGALIGAIAGGGQGAAVGAAVGAGAGAGSVILQGRDDLELNAGTEVAITASAPRGVATVR